MDHFPIPASEPNDLFDEYDDYDDEEHREDPPKPTNAISVLVRDCKKIGSDWEYAIEVTVAWREWLAAIVT